MSTFPIGRLKKKSAIEIALWTLVLISCRGGVFSFSVPALQSSITTRRQQRLPRHFMESAAFRTVHRPDFACSTASSCLIASMTPESSKQAEAKSLPLLSNIVHVIGSTTSIVVAGLFFIALAVKRDALMVSFFLGAIANAILSKILKRVLNQDRPQEGADVGYQPSDKGMPSSHAMSLGFIGTFTSLVLPWTRLWIVMYVACSLVFRIQTNLHTWQQVSVGLVVGTMNSAVWKLVLCDGNNPLGLNLMDWTSSHLLNANGVLPLSYMAIPLVVGALVVGSVERRIGTWIKSTKAE